MKCSCCDGTGQIAITSMAVWDGNLQINRGRVLIKETDGLKHFILDAIPAGMTAGDKLLPPDMGFPIASLAHTVASVSYGNRTISLAEEQ